MKKLLLANFKSNKSIVEANHWLDAFAKAADTAALERSTVAVAPSFLSLEEYSHLIKEKNLNLKLTTQNISAYPAGSYTGAVSVKNLGGLAIQYAIVGHSERRKYFGENSQIVAKKVLQAIDGGMTPIVCFDSEYLAEQIAAIEPELLAQCVFAYEPLSAIGSGNNADLGSVKEIKQQVHTLCNATVPFLYGGSVNPENVAEYVLVTDGVLVGSASLDAQVFARLVAAVQ